MLYKKFTATPRQPVNGFAGRKTIFPYLYLNLPKSLAIFLSDLCVLSHPQSKK